MAATLRYLDFSALRGLLHVETEVVAELVGADPFDGRRAFLVRSGAEGIRTPGLFAASEALCQLSYSPRKLIVGRPV
jgi:hypothetical protein